MHILKGRKTYIVAVAAGLVTVAQVLGLIDAELAITIYGLLGAGGLATLRMAMR